MRDKRPVDELSVEELERILAIKRREARQQRLQRLERDGRVLETPAQPVAVAQPAPIPQAALPANGHTAVQPAASSAPTTNGHLLSAPAAPVTSNGHSAAPQFADADPDGDADEAVMTYVPAGAATRKRAARRARTRVVNGLLLIVEVAAVFGIVFIAANLITAIQEFQSETAAAQQMAEEQRLAGIPTLAPTPTFRLEDHILPGGHTVSTEAGAQFNYAEVPTHLLPLVQSQWIQPVMSRPAPTSETALSLNVPSLNLNHVIVQGVDWEALRQGVGQLPNGVNPADDAGNVVLAAHNDIYGELFRDLDQLQVGDQFHIQTQTQLHTYTVTETHIVQPDEVWVMENRGAATATLISCYPYQVNDRRIVVFADRVL